MKVAPNPALLICVHGSFTDDRNSVVVAWYTLLSGYSSKSSLIAQNAVALAPSCEGVSAEGAGIRRSEL